ncbi:putative virulence determinant protein YopQ [Yersinia pseudotuberculosis]|uniref:type III secretion system effector YopK n=1 Tax=Yersinia pseudotuberculosis TaxID=633 RepID=UPI0005E93568|nr:type III secretion system effector YopK [Yersinia pseudotuberculosis]CNK84272.1 putative virulence determinant protein YopQ [Yersinia pseudotuberculosis]
MFIKDTYNMRALCTSLEQSAPDTIINTSKEENNSYYCATAHLLRTDVCSLVNRVGIEPLKSGSILSTLEELWQAVGIIYRLYEWQHVSDIDTNFKKLPNNSDFGLVFSVLDCDIEYVFIGKKDSEGNIEFYDPKNSLLIENDDIKKYLYDENFHRFCIMLIISKSELEELSRESCDQECIMG